LHGKAGSKCLDQSESGKPLFSWRNERGRRKKRKRLVFSSFLFSAIRDVQSLVLGRVGARRPCPARVEWGRGELERGQQQQQLVDSDRIGVSVVVELLRIRLLLAASSFRHLATRRSLPASSEHGRPRDAGRRCVIFLGVGRRSAIGEGILFFISASVAARPRLFPLSLSRTPPPPPPFPPPPPTKSTASDPPPKPELVERILSDPALLPRDASRRLAASAAAAAAARCPGDTGSPEAQVAALSQRISGLAAHLQAHRQDRSSSRGLQAMLARRRKLLQYLRRVNLAAYGRALARHSLKDRYAKLDRLGTRAAAAATAAAAAGAGGGKGKKKKRKK